MVQPAQHVPRVQDPGLVARRVARHVIRGSGPIGVNHQGGDFGRHLAAQRITGRNLVTGIRIANGDPVDLPGRRRIEDLATENRPPERVGSDLVARQQRAEVAGLERVGRRRVAETGQDAGAESRVVEVAEKECLVAV